MESNSRTPDGVEQPHFLNRPQPLSVHCNAQGLPDRICLRNRWYKVKQVADVWRVDDGWWTKQALSRIYVRLLLETTRPLVIFQDLNDLSWWRQNY